MFNLINIKGCGDIVAMQASSLKSLSESEVVKKIGSLFTKDQKKSGILASVSMAQFILESGYGHTELAQNANNCFGMKKSLSGNTWSGSTWDGKSIYTKTTLEEYTAGVITTITADFRKYPCIEDSIADHSAYLLGAKNGSSLRYAGLKGETNYKKAIQIIKDGGYATDSKYVEKICGIIERWNLTQFDVKKEEKSMAITPKTIHDITAQNRSQVPASRGGNPISWIVIHYLGVPNADNENLYGGGYGGHYYVSRAGTIYKAADPRTAVVWQCGGGIQGEGAGAHKYHGICTNYNSIGIENGVGFDNDWYFTTETQESLVYLVSTLMDEYGIDINHVIRHYDVTGKNCPAPYVSNNKHNTSWAWDEFKTTLANYRSGKITTNVLSFTPPTLKIGSTGKYVKLLQRLLCSRGMYAKKEIDSSYGAKTEAGVKKYQKWIKDHGGNIAVDGICGDVTWTSILGISGKPKVIKTSKAGDNNIYVYFIQELLKADGYYTGELDKSYGNQTVTAIKKFQKKKGLTQSGKCNYKTLKKLAGI